MIATHVGSTRTVVCASPGLLARHGVPKSPEDLADWPCVNFDLRSPSSTWPFRWKEGIRETPVKPRLSVSTAEAAAWAAAQNIGLTRVLHYQCAEAVRDGSLQIILEDFEIEPLPVHLVHAARGALPLKMRAFLDFAVGRIRKAVFSL
jgi:DNA-binding transcriptional LysR family regulator